MASEGSAPVDPATCGPAFGTIAFTAEVQGNHLVFTATWTAPLAGPAQEAVLSSYVVCCDGVVTTHFVETTVLDGSQEAVGSIRVGSIADECAAAPEIAVRSFLHWRQNGVDPPAVPGAAVFDAVFDRSGAAHRLLATTQWTDREAICFPPVS